MKRLVVVSALLAVTLLGVICFFLFSKNTIQEVTLERTSMHDSFALWYNQPASTRNTSNRWMEYGLPIGNGRLGAMVMGGILHDEIQLNDKTFWTGTPERLGAYQNLGSVIIEELDSTRFKSPAANYRLSLDLETAVAKSEWDDTQGTHLTREYLASYPDSCIAIHLTASTPGALHHRFLLKGTHDEDIHYDAFGAYMRKTLDVVTAVTGFRLSADADANILCSANGIEVRNASDIFVVIVCKTDYNPHAKRYVSGTQALDHLTQAALQEASNKGWPTLKARHLIDYQSLFNRMSFRLENATCDLPTDELVATYSKNATSAQRLHLEQLCFAYGRYLAIASSRGVQLPSNLQGIWCYSNRPIWNCDLHTNINIQMNYWPCEATHLGETAMPLLEWLCNETVTRYTENNIFGYSTPPEKTASYTGASAWLCWHLWQHFLYTQDTAFLREKALPAMLRCVDFWMQRLIRDADGTWVCPQEWSPEQGPLDNGTAHTQQCVWNLFSCTLKAIDIVGPSLAGLPTSRVAAIRAKFNAMDKGIHTETYNGDYGIIFNGVKQGQHLLREWKHHPYSAATEQIHRHLSHLTCLYPFDLLEDDSTLLQAARNSLLLRGDRNTGWSMAWKMCLWARLQDGEQAHRLLSTALRHAQAYHVTPELSASGIYYNLLSAHPPFQIDGNFGMTAGIAEMLFQSHGQTLRLLPALPEAWRSGGTIHGIRAEGGFEIDMEWDNEQMHATIRSLAGQPCRLQTQAGIYTEVFDASNHLIAKNDGQATLLSFDTTAGETFSVKSLR